MMKNKRELPLGTILLFVVAVGVLLFSGIGGARAALTYFSENYSSRVQMYDIGVSLNENGQKVSWRDYNANSDGAWNEATGSLLENLLESGESFKLGKTYPEEISVTNSGTIDTYVRVTIYKYWLDANGEKLQQLSPDLIGLHLVNPDTWLLDESASTAERTVLYYDRILAAGETSPALTDTLTVSGALASKVTQTVTIQDGKEVITTVYDYDGVRFQIEAQVDAVQTHNASDAIRSAWGRDVQISDGVLSLG